MVATASIGKGRSRSRKRRLGVGGGHPEGWLACSALPTSMATRTSSSGPGYRQQMLRSTSGYAHLLVRRALVFGRGLAFLLA